MVLQEKRRDDTMDVYRILFYTGLIIAIVFLILAVVLFFVLHIPKAVGIATGSTQRKAIEAIRATGYESRTRGLTSRRNKERIRAREADLESGKPKDGEEEEQNEQAAAEDAVEERAKKAAAEAASAGNRKLSGRRGKNKKLGLENERTEVLGTEDDESDQYGIGGQGEATDVLGKEDATDVLESFRSEDARRTNTYNEDLELKTDVLSNSSAMQGFAAAAASGLEDETALLSSGDGQGTPVSGEELTSVLQTPEGGEGDIPLTTVLSDPTVKPEDLEIGEKKRIIVLLSETVVHTSESL